MRATGPIEIAVKVKLQADILRVSAEVNLVIRDVVVM
jgi:hypothetical protein